MNAPVDVDQTSPLVGEVGAVPGIIRRLDTVVVEPKIFKFVLAEVAIPTPAKVSVGVVMVGEPDNTTFVVPVEVKTPVPPLATGKVPVTPVVSGSPVAFVSVAEDGVPSAGVTSVGEVENTKFVEVVPVAPAAV